MNALGKPAKSNTAEYPWPDTRHNKIALIISELGLNQIYDSETSITVN
jgi:hypothetical protein